MEHVQPGPSPMVARTAYQPIHTAISVTHSSSHIQQKYWNVKELQTVTPSSFTNTATIGHVHVGDHRQVQHYEGVSTQGQGQIMYHNMTAGRCQGQQYDAVRTHTLPPTPSPPVLTREDHDTLENNNIRVSHLNRPHPANLDMSVMSYQRHVKCLSILSGPPHSHHTIHHHHYRHRHHLMNKHAHK